MGLPLPKAPPDFDNDIKGLSIKASTRVPWAHDTTTRCQFVSASTEQSAAAAVHVSGFASRNKPPLSLKPNTNAVSTAGVA
jgi:hypothetical protein